MFKHGMNLGLAIFTLSAIMVSSPIHVMAETSSTEYTVEASEIITETVYNIKVQKEGISLYDEANIGAEAVMGVDKGSILEVEEITDGDWVKVEIEGREGYIKASNGAGLIFETTKESVDEETMLRQKIVDLALSFEGGAYVWGGVNPYTGVDCSGFTRYVMAEILGKSLPHSSRAQANMGTEVSVSNMRPGDLLFYANGAINHVGIYIGNGKVISASTEKTGIKVSHYNYRNPVKVVSMF